MYVRLTVHPSENLIVHPSVFLFPLSLSVRSSDRLSVQTYIHLRVSVWLLVYLSLCLSLSAFLSFYIWVGARGCSVCVYLTMDGCPHALCALLRVHMQEPKQTDKQTERRTPVWTHSNKHRTCAHPLMDKKRQTDIHTHGCSHIYNHRASAYPLTDRKTFSSVLLNDTTKVITGIHCTCNVVSSLN